MSSSARRGHSYAARSTRHEEHLHRSINTEHDTFYHYSQAPIMQQSKPASSTTSIDLEDARFYSYTHALITRQSKQQIDNQTSSLISTSKEDRRSSSNQRRTPTIEIELLDTSMNSISTVIAPTPTISNTTNNIL